jgi:hypothetical protein
MKKEFTCEVSCQLCSWSTGVTIMADETNLFEEILSFLRACSKQHLKQGSKGKLLVAWEPLEGQTLEMAS